MAGIVMYSSRYCPYCMRAKSLLESKGADFEAIEIDGKPDIRREMIDRAGSQTVPQIWISEQYIGGCDELYQLERDGFLDSILDEITER